MKVKKEKEEGEEEVEIWNQPPVSFSEYSRSVSFYFFGLLNSISSDFRSGSYYGNGPRSATISDRGRAQHAPSLREIPLRNVAPSLHFDDTFNS